MAKFFAIAFLILAFLLAIANPYTVTPMVFGKMPIFIGIFAAGMGFAMLLDAIDKKYK